MLNPEMYLLDCVEESVLNELKIEFITNHCQSVNYLTFLEVTISRLMLLYSDLKELQNEG